MRRFLVRVGVLPDVHGLAGFSGTSGSWATVTSVLNWASYPADFRVRFVHGSDHQIHGFGAYIDNISLWVE